MGAFVAIDLIMLRLQTKNMKLKPVQHGGDRYRLPVNETFEDGMVIHMRAKLGYLTEDIVNLNNVYFEENAVKTSKWSPHKQLQLSLKLQHRSSTSDIDTKTNDHDYDPNKYPGVNKLKIKCKIGMDYNYFGWRKNWVLYYNERKQEFTYNHLVEKARKAAKQTKICYFKASTCEFIVEGPDGDNIVSNQQDFEEYCINAPDPSNIHMRIILDDEDDTSSSESEPAEKMTIECAVFINGYQYCNKWMLYDDNRTYDNLVVQARRVVGGQKVVNYENIKFIFIIDGKYQVSNQQEFVKYCINAPNPHYVKMETFINSHTLWMPA